MLGVSDGESLSPVVM